MASTEPALRPLDRRPTADRVADLIRARIVDGTFAPGTQLGEVQLAEQLGVSRGPVREAMQRLIQEGLLRSEPHRGTFVVRLDDDDVADIYLARSAIERAAAVQLVRRDDRQALTRLAKLVERMETATRSESWSRVADLDLEFHESLVASSGSRRLVRMYDTLLAETRICLAALEADYPVWHDVVTEHEQVVAALRAGDEAAVVDAVDAHLHQATARRRNRS